jgi:adenylate cyclase class 2
MVKSAETKAFLLEKEKFLVHMERLGVSFSIPERQLDTYFTKDKKDFEVFRPKENFLRIRDEKGIIYFTLKQPQTNELDVIDKTVEVGDKEVLGEIILLLGYQKIISVNKTRQIASYNGWNLCVDAVDGLGDFIEIKYSGEGDSEDFQRKQKEFLFSLGIDENAITLSGYDTLLYKKERGIY